jgi:ribonuclease E
MPKNCSGTSTTCCSIWRAIAEAALSKPSPFLIYQESRLIVRALRDYMRADVGEILVDTPEMYAEALDFVEQVMPHNKRKLKHYTDDTPLFNRFQIESQIESLTSAPCACRPAARW